MVAITRIDFRVKTGDRQGAATNGDVYVGIGGREFSIDKAGSNDFERGADQTYVAGLGSTINFPDINNPTSPYQLLTERLDKYPVYSTLRTRESRRSLEP